MSKNKFLIGLKKGQREFGETIAAVINAILLTIVYFLGVGLTNLIARFSNKNFLEMKTDKNKKSYWENLNLGKKNKEDYFKQF